MVATLKTTISCVIPHMTGIDFAEENLSLCLKSLEYRVDEIIVERNDGIGFARAVNLGIAKTTGDYIIVANNDTRLVSGNLFKLVKAINVVTVPTIEPTPRDNLPRSFYCISRVAYNMIVKEYGYFYDETFEKGYWEDDDLIKRIKTIGLTIIQEPSVIVYHLNGGGMTMHQLPEGEPYWFNKNKKIYEEKWS